MSLKSPDVPGRQSIGAASQFIRGVGRREKNNTWGEKARKIDDMLEAGSVVVDDKIAAGTDGEVDTDSKTTQRIRLQKDVPLSKDGATLDPGNPDFIRLVGILLRLADLMLGHGYLEAYGEELAFYQAVNENFGKYFPDLKPADAAAVEKRKKELEKAATDERKKRLDKEPPPPAKRGKIDVTPDPK
jgi:hypothetical protein